MDRTGRVVIPPQFADAGNFSEGLAAVQPSETEHKYGYIDTSGKMVIPPQFEMTEIFPRVWLRSLGRGLIERHCVGFIDRTGKMSSRLQWAFFITWRFFRWPGPGKVAKIFKWGYVDKTGKMVIPAPV